MEINSEMGVGKREIEEVRYDYNEKQADVLSTKLS